jgi:hypothetical protein
MSKESPEALLAEMERLEIELRNEGDGWLTRKDLCKLWDMSRDAIFKRLELANDLGWLQTKHVIRTRVDGNKASKPAYKIERPKTKKKKK